MFKKVVDAVYNPIDAKLKRLAKEGGQSVAVIWNRGLGDIPLGLCAFVHRAREVVPDVRITFVTRPDLADAFRLIGDVEVVTSTKLQRGQPIPELPLEPYDLVFESLDPTRHLKWQRGSFTPKLEWDEGLDALTDAFPLERDRKYLGVHVNSETGHIYGYNKNWPEAKWRALFERSPFPVILFGHMASGEYPGCIDLRGKTSLFGMLSIMLNRCVAFVGPDSGLVSIAYYLAAPRPLKLVSLWADPKQGILRQGVDSPNPLLIHTPCIAKRGKIEKIEVDEVAGALFG